MYVTNSSSSSGHVNSNSSSNENKRFYFSLSQCARKLVCFLEKKKNASKRRSKKRICFYCKAWRKKPQNWSFRVCRKKKKKKKKRRTYVKNSCVYLRLIPLDVTFVSFSSKKKINNQCGVISICRVFARGATNPRCLVLLLFLWKFLSLLHVSEFLFNR